MTFRNKNTGGIEIAFFAIFSVIDEMFIAHLDNRLEVAVLLITSCLTFFSCQSKEKVNASDQLGLKVEELQAKTIADSTKIDSKMKKKEIESIRFQNFEVRIYNFSANGVYLSNPNSDTAIIDQDPGSTFENTILEIIPMDSSDRFEIKETYTTGLRVYVGEKEVKDLKRWETTTDDKVLQDSNKFFFKTLNYRIETKEKALDKDFKEIKDSVLDFKGEYIEEELDTASALKFLPVEFWVIKSVIKIRRITKNGNFGEKIIIIRSAWGVLTLLIQIHLSAMSINRIFYPLSFSLTLH